jgi:SAM-dependent methyltransferase
MTASKAPSAWNSGDAYESYVGRWSRHVARRFLDWLAPPGQVTWADIGCGTGALTSTILAVAEPTSVMGVDASPQFIEQARQRVTDSRARFEPGDATRLPWPADAVRCSVSGLVLNFVPDHAAMVREMARVTQPGGTVALYVWDYADGMQMMRSLLGRRSTDRSRRRAVRRIAALSDLQAGAVARPVPAGGPDRRGHAADRHRHRVRQLRRLLAPLPRAHRCCTGLSRHVGRARSAAHPGTAGDAVAGGR